MIIFFIFVKKRQKCKNFGNRVSLSDLENNISKLGIQSICKLIQENIITIFVRKKKEEKIVRDNVKNLSNLHPSIFKIKIIKKFPMNKNFKISYNDKRLK